MKQLLIVLLTVTLFTACNNSNNGMLKGKTKSNWTSKDRTKALSDCEDELPDNPQAKEICSCLLEKVEKKYPEPEDVEKKSSKEEIANMTRACLAGDVGGGDADDNGGKIKKPKVIDEDGGEGWTSSQREKFIEGCATAAKQNLGASKANSYCECMQNKIEKKYKLSFAQANKLTNEDFSTPDVKADIQECRGDY
jgi:hypothetical protein